MTSVGRAWLLPVIIAALFVSLPGVSPAEINATSKTYLKYYTDARDNDYTPLFEYVELEGRDRERGQWTFSLASWLGYDFQTTTGGDRRRGDLTYAVVRFSPYQDRHLLLSLGRQYIFEGVAAEEIDGVAGRWEMTRADGISLYGGSPVAAEFDRRSGDTAYGGRAYHRFSLAEIGASALYETNDRERFREKIGADVWWRPFRFIEMKGHSFYNNMTEGWEEHVYALRIFPLDALVLSGIFSRSSYDDAFATRTLDVFSSEFLGEKETLTKAGGLAEYRFGDSVTVVADALNYAYRIMGHANYYGGRISASFSDLSAGATFHRMDGPVERLRYIETRLYAAADREDWRLTLDAINIHYDQPFNDVDDAYSVNGTLRCGISDSLASGISVDYSRTPDFNDRTTALLNIVYNFGSGR